MAVTNAEKWPQANAIHGLILTLVPTMVVLTIVVPLPIIPAMTQAFSGEPNAAALVSLAIVLPTLAIAVSGALLGFLGDRVDRKTLLLLGTGLFSAAVVLPLWLTSLPLLLISRAVAGLALGGMTMAAIGLTADYFDGPRRQFWLAAQSGVPAAAAILASVASGALGEINWRLPFLLLSSGLVLFFMQLFIPWPKQSLTNVTATKTEISEAPFPWRKLATVFSLTVIASLIIFPPGYEFGFILLERSQGSSMLAGLMTAVLALGAVIGAFALGLLQRWSTFVKILVSFAVAGIGMSLVTLSSELIIAMSGAAIIGVGQGMVVPSLSFLLLEQSDESARGRAVGVFQTLLYLSQFAAPQLARAISSANSSSVFGMRLYSFASLFIAALMIAGLLKRRRSTSSYHIHSRQGETRL